MLEKNFSMLKNSSDMIFNNKDLKKLIVPLIIEQILAITVGMVDTVMISSSGEAAISGVSLVDMVNNLLINIFAAIATGGAVVASQYIGKKETKTACNCANQLLIITALISCFIMALTLLFQRPLLLLLYHKVEPEVMNNALIYLSISAISYPFLAIYNSCAALFRSMGNSKISMQVSVAMNLLNVVGNALFIFVFHMGVAGAAWSSMISRTLAALFMLYLLQKKENLIHINLKKIFHIDILLIRKILYIGIPNGIENGLFQLGRVLVVSIIATFGTTQIAANAVANNLDSMGCIAGQAMNLAMITVVGRCVGAGDEKQVIFYTKKLLRITYLLTAILNISILLLLPVLLKLYTLTKEAAQLSSILIWIHNGFAMLLWPISFTLSNALRAANDVKYTMIISIFSMLAFRIVLSVVFGIWFGLGAIGVWIAMLFDWIFRSFMFVRRFRQGKWKELSIL